MSLKMTDPNLQTDIPAPIKAKITQFKNATVDMAFVGMAMPEDRAQIEEYFEVARYDLERTIKTFLERQSVNQEDIAPIYQQIFFAQDEDGVLRRWIPPDLEARDKRVKEKTLREAMVTFPIFPPWSWSAQEIHNKLLSIYQEKTDEL